MNKQEQYIPALSFDWLTPLYDPILKGIFHEEHFKQILLGQADLQPGHSVLDLGCGTATLTILLKRAQPEAFIAGLDGDAQVLTITAHKVSVAEFSFPLLQGMAFQLPFGNQSFDRVLSSLVFHHLNTANKQRTLAEVYRILRPQGELHILDFGRPDNVLAQLISLITRNFEEVADNIDGLLPGMFRHAGFIEVEETAHFMTIMGTLTLYKARKSG